MKLSRPKMDITFQRLSPDKAVL